MQRLIEQLADDGEVREGLTRLGRVHYHLSVYQHFSGRDGEPVPASLSVEGQMTPLDPIDLAGLHQRRAELTLLLADERVLQFSVATRDGGIRSTARGLFPPTRP
jgi:hypothetical protein